MVIYMVSIHGVIIFLEIILDGYLYIYGYPMISPWNATGLTCHLCRSMRKAVTPASSSRCLWQATVGGQSFSDRCFFWLNTHIHMYIQICISVKRIIYIYIYRHMSVCICICRVYVHVYVYEHVYVYVYVLCICMSFLTSFGM